MTRNRRIISGILVLLALGAGVVALRSGRLAPPPAAAQRSEDAPNDVAVIAVEQVNNGVRSAGEVTVTFVNPNGLPAGAPSQTGVFVARDGDALTLGTGRIAVEVEVEQENDGEPLISAVSSYDGPDVTVQLSAATTYLQLAADPPEITPDVIAAGELVVTRKAAPGSVDALTANMIIRVWGTVVDGVLVADTVAYEMPR